MIFVALISIEKNKILSYIVISIASLIKIYPIFIFIGIIVMLSFFIIDLYFEVLESKFNFKNF